LFWIAETERLKIPTKWIRLKRRKKVRRFFYAEVLANATVSITINNFTYQPQDIPLVQWLEMGPTSSAIDGAFSYPGETVLARPAIPCL
jgi:hypothetical protein